MGHILEQFPHIDQWINPSDLRSQPMNNLEAFRRILAPYSVDDYQGLGGPYEKLVEASHYQNALFDQLAVILCDDAVSKGCPRWQVDDTIAAIKQIYLDGIVESTTILELIDKVEADTANSDKVSVMPLMCGSGKSNAITFKIKEVIEKGDGSGMIVVTDSIERLEKYWNPNADNRRIDEKTRRFINEHEKDVVELTNETYLEGYRKQKAVPILLMTTQRYFSLTKDQIEEFLVWGDNHRRNLIIFDEQPYLNLVYEITAATFNSIDSALRLAIDDTADQDEKRWCVEQWNAFRCRMLDLLLRFEYDQDVPLMYYEDRSHAMTEDDARFMAFVQHHRNPLHAYRDDAYTQILAVQKLVQTWGLYVYRKKETGAYESKLMVYIDNREKVTGFDAKVIVLDGTGDISPVYTDQDYIDLRSGDDYVRTLSALTIRIGDIKTGQDDLSADRYWSCKAITKYLLAHESKNNIVVFTYKNREQVFKKTFNHADQVAHFNNIKGLNKYMTVPCIAQVGLNRYQTAYYLTYLLERDEAFRLSLQDLPIMDQKAAIDSKLRETDNCASIMLPQILSDIEQNVFRSAIRNINNQHRVTYYLFFNKSTYPGLYEMIESRYHDRLRANIENICFEEIKDMMAEEDATAAQKIREWYEGWDGTAIKRKAMIERIGITNSSFKATLSRDAKLKALFETARTAAKEKGYSGGWYMK